MHYGSHMVHIVTTPQFDKWIGNLRDKVAVARVRARIDMLSVGNPGDVKPVGSGVSEMRINFGPGYRVYYVQKGLIVIVILCGGDKSSQRDDIKRAIQLSREIEV